MKSRSNSQSVVSLARGANIGPSNTRILDVGTDKERLSVLPFVGFQLHCLR